MLQVLEKQIDELKPWEDNPRLNDHAVSAVAKSIAAFGFNVPILCDQNLTIVAGHTRWKAARQMGLASVPVIVLDMTDEQRKAFAIADNKTAEIADWDFPKLRDVLEELRLEGCDLHDLGFSDANLRKILLGEEINEDDLPPLPESPQSKAGDIFRLGRHLLLCGDSSNRLVLQELMREKTVSIVIGGAPCFNQKGFGDWKTIEDYLGDMRAVMQNCSGFLKDGGVFFWDIGSSSSTHHNLPSYHARLFEEEGLEYLDTIAWIRPGVSPLNKRNAHIERNRFYYPANQWISILVYRKPGPMPRMTYEGSRYMSDFPSDVWEVQHLTNPLEKPDHPAVCPLEIPYRALMAYTQDGDVVLDPFAGSGTTLIAAEKAGRIAMLVERQPKYCDVIIQRWQDFTGDKASKLPGHGGLA